MSAPRPDDPRDELVQHLGAMRAFAVSLTRNPATADDLVQETLVKAWAHMDRFRTGSNMRAWLFTILRNSYYSMRRKHRREVEDAEGALAGALAQKPEHDGRLQMREFVTAFDQLPDEQREALILVGAGGFTYEEAAAMCGVRVGTVKSRVNRARTRLAELLELSAGDALHMTDSVTQGIVVGNQSAA